MIGHLSSNFASLQIDDFNVKTNQISNDFDSILKKFETFLRLKYGTLMHQSQFPGSEMVGQLERVFADSHFEVRFVVNAVACLRIRKICGVVFIILFNKTWH